MRADVHASIRAYVQTTEGALHSVDQRAVLELFKDRDSRSGFFWLLNTKARWSKVEKRTDLRKDQWEDASLSRWSFDITAIHEDIGFPRVTMQVTVHDTGSFHVHLLNESFRMVHSWLQLLRWELPATIQITACKWAPIIAVDDAIWIEHGHYLEDEALSE